MKTIKKLLIIPILLLTITSQGQFLKKLGKIAEKSAKKTIERKVDKKTEKETDKTFDKVLEKPSKEVSSDVIPNASYQFTHKYVMRFDDGKNPVNITYYLNKNTNHIATVIDEKGGEKDMITLIDSDQNNIIIFMDNGMMMTTKLNMKKTIAEANDVYKPQITATGKTKSILGYTCQEYHVVGTDFESDVWMTKEAPITFPKAFYKSAKKQKKNQKNQWMTHMDGMMMEMHVTDTSKRKTKTSHTTCIALESSNFTIDTSKYKKMIY